MSECILIISKFMCWLSWTFHVSNMNLLTHIRHMRINFNISRFFCGNFYWLDAIDIVVNLPGHHNDSSSCSSAPESPHGDHSGRTQYVSATCVVVTHYSGDVANVVDEHFTRALNFNDKASKGEWRVWRQSLITRHILWLNTPTIPRSFRRYVAISTSC